MALLGAVAKIGAGMLKGRAKKQTGAEVAAKVTGKKESVYRAKANPNATSSELDAKKIVPVAASTENISKSQGSGSGTKSLKESALRIKVTTIEVNTLLRGSLALDKMRAKNKKETREELKRTNAEDQLEKDNKGKFSFPIPGAKKVKSFWERIKKFFLTMFFGMIGLKLLPLLPHLLKALPFIAKAADWLVNLAIGIVDVLASAIKIGYDAVEGAEKWVGDTFGEEAAEKFNSFMGGLTQVMNAIFALGMAAAAFGGGIPGLPGGKSKGPKPDIDPKTGKRIKKNQIIDANTGKVRPKTKLEKNLHKKLGSDDAVKQYQKARAGGANVQQALEQAKKVKPKPKKVGFWGKVGKGVSGAASAVGKGVVSGAAAVGKGIKGALNLLPNFNKLGDELAGVLTDQYKNISAQARKQYDNVVGLAVKLKGKWDNALGAAGNAFNKLKEGAKQKIMEKVLEPAQKFLEPLKKKLGAIGEKIMGVIQKIPGFDKVMQVLKKNGVSSLGDAKGILKKIGGKAIPVIGGIINLAFAYDRLAGGDTVGGLLEGASGVLDLLGLVPGFQWGPGVSMGIDAYMFARDFVPQLKEGEDKAIGALGLTGLQNDMDKMFAALPDLGTITKMITGGDKEKKEPVEGAGGGESKGAPLGETDAGGAAAKGVSKEDGGGASAGAKSVSDQEEKLLATNQQSGAQGVIDSISTTASYEDEDGVDAQAAYDRGYSDGSSGAEKMQVPTKTKKQVGSPAAVGSGGGSDPYEGLYKGS